MEISAQRSPGAINLADRGDQKRSRRFPHHQV